MTTGVGEPQATQTSSNVFSRIAGVLFAPAETFQDIVRSPKILAPILLFVALGYLSTIVMVPRIDFESVRAAQTKAMEKRGAKMTEQDLARIQNMSIAAAKVGMWVNPLLMVVLYVILAGLLWFSFRLMGGEGNFAQAFAVTLYAWVPMILYSIVTAIVVLARGSFDPMSAATLVKSNPAFLVDHEAQPVLFSLLASFDLFTFWTLFLLAIGFAAVSRLSRAMSAGIVISLWVVFVLLRLGYAALTG
jgi:hypothetical protein